MYPAVSSGHLPTYMHLRFKTLLPGIARKPFVLMALIDILLLIDIASYTSFFSVTYCSVIGGHLKVLTRKM